jgi:hypothetical protein
LRIAVDAVDAIWWYDNMIQARASETARAFFFPLSHDIVTW